MHCSIWWTGVARRNWRPESSDRSLTLAGGSDPMAFLDGPELADADPVRTERVRDDWVELLSSPGPGRDDALARLHGLLLKAARHQVSQMFARLPAIGQARREDIVNQAADEAMVAVLGKLSSFQGRSQFTTWAYKFGILHAAVEVRRNLWHNREVPLESMPEPAAVGTSPEQLAEAADFSNAVSAAIDQVLTKHQRRVVLALLVDDVPFDVLADRLGTTRNALYKTLHDARGRLRTHLTVAGYLVPTRAEEVIP
ncbi:RNA polymerase sigma factor [Pseudarthrobacter albicanus]|uniref:RNA polymerase sigma factor n=1 Tax=Pseudarthrobacter albicanus TaxID=2823873 RepID=UPI001FE79D97|nr:sigma-70 family RNA polymerase sigma factor [Pseudarthrobacter albicanus]